jgi:hypothetical protein
MFQSFRPSSRKMRPVLDLLEQRALLNAAMPHLHRHPAVPAEVTAAKRPVVPIVPNLPSTPNFRITTIPASGDVNPYGLAVVPAGFPSGGPLHPGEFLVANFNNSTNTQGTGTTIVTVTPNGQNPATAPVFFTSQAVGLTEALEVLKSGFVIVGNVPTTDGTFGTIGPGSLQIINRFGQVVQTLTDANTDSNLFDGPWASAVIDKGNTAQLFISNVEGGTVERINLKAVKHHGQTNLKVASITQIASGYLVQPNSAAVIVGPGGLAYNPKNGTLYVAATGNNEIFAVPHASTTHSDHGTGTLVYQDQAHLRGPIGLALAPNGDLLTTNDDAVNGDPSQPSELIEFTPNGQFVGELSLDPAQGAAFQLVVQSTRHTVTIATLNDDLDTVDFRTITT